MKSKLDNNYEYIIVGTGPAGGTIAYELSKAGKNVLIIERGAWHEKALGFPFGLRILHGLALFSKSTEGAIVGRGITVGGSTMVYNANVYNTPDFIYEKMGIDFRTEVNEVKEEIDTYLLPDRFLRTHMEAIVSANLLKKWESRSNSRKSLSIQINAKSDATGACWVARIMQSGHRGSM